MAKTVSGMDQGDERKRTIAEADRLDVKGEIQVEDPQA